MGSKQAPREVERVLEAVALANRAPSTLHPQSHGLQRRLEVRQGRSLEEAYQQGAESPAPAAPPQP